LMFIAVLLMDPCEWCQVIQGRAGAAPRRRQRGRFLVVRPDDGASTGREAHRS
jgi:hypothetical protein